MLKGIETKIIMGKYFDIHETEKILYNLNENLESWKGLLIKEAPVAQADRAPVS